MGRTNRAFQTRSKSEEGVVASIELVVVRYGRRQAHHPPNLGYLKYGNLEREYSCEDATISLTNTVDIEEAAKDCIVDFTLSLNESATATSFRFGESM